MQIKKINNMDEKRTHDVNLIAYCGLYCGECRKYINKKCPGCRKNQKASWCKVRTCNQQRGYHTCADCMTDVAECKKYDNFFSKLFGFIFRSDRKACIYRIKEVGRESYAKEMCDQKKMTIKK